MPTDEGIPMLQRLLDYLVSIALGAVVGLAIGALCDDPWGGALIGGAVGIFMGAAVRAWRTRDVREGYEDRGLSD